MSVSGRRIYTEGMERWARDHSKRQVQGRKVEEDLTGYEVRQHPFESPEEVRDRLKFLGKLFTDAQQDAALLLSGFHTSVCPDLLRMAREWQPVAMEQRMGRWGNHHPTERPFATARISCSIGSPTTMPSPCAMSGRTTRTGAPNSRSRSLPPVWHIGIRTRAARFCVRC